MGTGKGKRFNTETTEVAQSSQRSGGLEAGERGLWSVADEHAAESGVGVRGAGKDVLRSSGHAGATNVGAAVEGAKYNPWVIEAKWQRRWEEAGVFETEADPSKPKYYVLEMLPYPSGTMHMGHMRNYAIGDVVARVKRMQGFNVLHPMGWDAFGLPAGNAAVKNKTHPREWTNKNIAQFQRVLRRFGFS